MEQAKESKTGEREQQQLQQQGVRREVNKPDECAVCVSTFDEIERRPRTLPCGYSFCTCCVVGLMTEGQLLCPSCGVKHPAPSVDHFPISHGIEALIKNLRSRVLTQGSLSQEYVDPAAKARPTALGPHERCEAAISERQQVLLQEKKTHFSFLIQQYQDMKAQLEQYHTQLAGWRDQHHQLEEALFLLAKKNKEAKDFVEQEISKAIAAKEQGDDGEQKVAAMQGRFDIPSTAGEADEVMDTAYRCAGVAETWKWKCWKTFPNPTIVTNSLKILEMTEVVADAAGRVLETAGAEAGATTAPKPQGGTASTIQDRVQALVPVKDNQMNKVKTADCAHSLPCSKTVMKVMQQADFVNTVWGEGDSACPGLGLDHLTCGWELKDETDVSEWDSESALPNCIFQEEEDAHEYLETVYCVPLTSDDSSSWCEWSDDSESGPEI